MRYNDSSILEIAEALGQDSSGNKQATMTDIDFANQMLRSLVAERQHLQKQRDELLEALGKLEKRGFFTESICADAETNADMAEMRSVIAKVKGGAQ